MTPAAPAPAPDPVATQVVALLCHPDDLKPGDVCGHGTFLGWYDHPDRGRLYEFSQPGEEHPESPYKGAREIDVALTPVLLLAVLRLA